jgi:hypothetical protein
MPGDLHYSNGQWEPANLLADCPEGTDPDAHLRATGWEGFLTVGDIDSAMWIKTWRKKDDDSGFLIEVGDVATDSPYIQVDTFPELMDFLARWAPVVQAAAMVHVLDDLSHYEIRGDGPLEMGMVEMLAARARYGAQDRYESIVSDYRQRRRGRAQSRMANQ